MLKIEGGGEEQAKEEIHAYNPLVPEGNSLTFTLMFEIDNKQKRSEVLGQLGGVEESIELQFLQNKIKATSAAGDEVERTTADGKTSAVHFLKFTLTEKEKNDFKNLSESNQVILAIGHQNYNHATFLSPVLTNALKEDLS